MTSWAVFGLVALFALWGLIAVFFVLEVPGIRAGTPFTRYLRGWIRDPRWWVRWPLGVVILGTIAVVAIGGIWLAYHLTFECVLTDGVGCA